MSWWDEDSSHTGAMGADGRETVVILVQWGQGELVG